MSIDLTPAREALDRIRRDRCRITWQEEGHTVGDVDPNTGEIINVPDPELLYEGFCRVSSAARDGGRTQDEFVQPKSDQDYMLSLPTNAPEIPPGAIAEMTEIDPEMGDPALLGKQFTITGGVHTSFHVQRKLRMELVVPNDGD